MVVELLRGDYKQSGYGKVILPFTVLRRLDRERNQAIPVEELPDTPLSAPWETDRVTVLITDVE